MRIWTIHPRHLDAKGLVALWREGLLARAVLAGRTRGYVSHPQLVRFRAHEYPLAAITDYLHVVLEEARARGYRFDGSKLSPITGVGRIVETSGQLQYEWEHLMNKLRARDPDLHAVNRGAAPSPHPLFRIVSGDVREWEKRT